MKSSNLTTVMAVAALTFGIASPRLAPAEVEPPLSTNDIVIAADDTATDDEAESVKMNKDATTENGVDETSDTDTKKIDQPERQDDGTMDGDGEERQ